MQDDEINHIVVDDGIMTPFITINSTTASPKTAELLPAAAASGYVAAADRLLSAGLRKLSAAER